MRLSGQWQITTRSLLGAVAGDGGTQLLDARHVMGHGGPMPALRRIAQSVDDPCEFQWCLSQQGGDAVLLE